MRCPPVRSMTLLVGATQPLVRVHQHRQVEGRRITTWLGGERVHDFAQPTWMVPVTEICVRLGDRFTYDLPAQSITFTRLRGR